MIACTSPRCNFQLILTVATMLLHATSGAVMGSADEPPSRPPWRRATLQTPSFINISEHQQHVICPVSRPAHLHCRVRHLGDQSVSWVRKRDLHILTVGMFTYTTDTRFQALHSAGSTDWTLKLLAPTFSDSGLYECQISTEPVSRLTFRLSVVVSRARIIGASELHVRAGTDVNLTCHVTHRHDPIFWYRDDHVINYMRHERLHLHSANGVSRLRILPVRRDDSGNYTCAPISAHPASVTLHVISEEPPAAMQHNEAPTAPPTRQLAQLILIGILLRFSRLD